MNFEKKLVMYVGAGALFLSLNGCGSGGELDEVSAPDSSNKINITTQNSDKVLALTVGGVSTIPLTIPNIPDFNIAELFVASLVDHDCDEGGHIEIEDVDSKGGWIIFKNCTQKGVTINGEADVSVDGNRYDIALDNIHIKDSRGEATLERVYLTTVGNDFSANFVSASINYDGYSAELSNYQVSRTGSNMSITGMLSANCIGGWIEVKTQSPMNVVGDSCPSGGQVQVLGNSSDMLIKFNSDQSVDTIVNGAEDKHYGSCQELKSLINSCK